MSTTALTINGLDVQKAKLFVPNEGVWFLDADLTGQEPLTGLVSVRLGASTLSGTIDDSNSGTFGLRRKVRVIGGRAGWRKEIKPQGYRNDAGVKASKIAADAALACGEQLGTFAGAVEKLGAHYMREAGPASRTLEDAARGAPWWVGFDGVTHVSQRTTRDADPSTYERVTYDARSHVLVLQVLDLESVGVGSVITKDVDAPLTVSSFELSITTEAIRMHAWCGEGRGSNLIRAWRAALGRSSDKRITWPVRYRVVDLSGDRVDLQVVKRGSGAPDVLSVPMWPGIAGAHVISARGAEVIVQFVDGDRADPIVTNFAGRGGKGAIPKRLVLGAASGDGQNAARQGDVVEMVLPPFTFSGTIGGSPAAGLLTAALPRAVGTIITGAPGVGIGNDAGS